MHFTSPSFEYSTNRYSSEGGLKLNGSMVIILEGQKHRYHWMEPIRIFWTFSFPLSWYRVWYHEEELWCTDRVELRPLQRQSTGKSLSYTLTLRLLIIIGHDVLRSERQVHCWQALTPRLTTVLRLGNGQLGGKAGFLYCSIIGPTSKYEGT